MGLASLWNCAISDLSRVLLLQFSLALICWFDGGISNVLLERVSSLRLMPLSSPLSLLVGYLLSAQTWFLIKVQEHTGDCRGNGLSCWLTLTVANTALDHSCINLPLTCRANDAHSKRCPRGNILTHVLLYLLLLFPCVGSLVLSPATTHLMFLLFNSFSSPSFMQHFISLFLTLHSLITPAFTSFYPGPPGFPDPQTEDFSGAALGVRSSQRTQHRGRLRRRF